MDKGGSFETLADGYSRRRGFKAELTSHSSDYRADIILHSNNSTIVVQINHLSDGKVSIGLIQEIAAVIKHFNADEGWTKKVLIQKEA
jgi:HJR/Mrr/RecB family endonuclease